MKNTTILFLINRDTTDESIATFAEASAAIDAHLSCFMLGLAPELLTYGFGIPPYGTFNVPPDWAERLEVEYQLEKARVQEIESVLARANVSGDVQSAFCVPGEIKHRVAQKARVSDVAYIAPNLRETDEFREAASGVLFGSPIGLMLNCTAPILPKSAFIAWDSSKAASRAVHAALPALKETEVIVVGCFDPMATESADGANPGSGLAAWLSHHGCNVTVSQYPSGGAEVATCIQDRAREVGADMVIMGAYGHARVIQAVFGGTSRTMMEQTDLPVFFAH